MTDYQSLKSGTDIRGDALGEKAVLTNEVALCIGGAFITWLSEKTGKRPGALTVAIGRDSRLTGPALLAACAEGMARTGAQVWDYGMCTTPAMYMSLLTEGFKADASIMVTASHHPYYRNGLKFFLPEGGVSATDISMILSIAANTAPVDGPHPAVQKRDFLPVYKQQLMDRMRRGLDTDVACPLLGLHVVVDAGNGAGGFYEEMLREMGAWTEGSQFLEPDGHFPNHIPNPENEQAMAAMLAHINDSFEICTPEDKVPAVAGLAIAMKRLVEKYGCNAGAIQCWNALQDELGIMPCAANAILNEMGIPIVCETDIHGAITALMVEAADLGRHRGMFADWTVRHPDNENGELLQHCGPWPCSCAAVKPKLTYPLAFDHPGALTAEAKHGDLTLARFDGDNGEYSLLLGNARGIDGPAGMGTYLWVEVDNLKRLEAKIVEGPYIHHCVAIHANVVPVLYEACKYIGIAPDLYDPIEEDVKAYLRGE